MTELLMPGLELLVVGMGIVFIFLTLLIFILNIMSSIIQRYFPEPQLITKKAQENQIDPDVLAAISAAVHRHRAGRTE